MIALDTNVLLYACDRADPKRQQIAIDLITNSRDGVLLWQVACEFVAASRKLSAQGFSASDAWNRLGEFLNLFPLVLPTAGVLTRGERVARTADFAVRVFSVDHISGVVIWRRVEITASFSFGPIFLHHRAPAPWRTKLIEADFRLLARAFNRARALHPFDLTAWVFLPDHWHCIVAPRYPVTISQVIKCVKQSSMTGINQRRGTEGELWQSRFFDRALRTVKEYHEKLDYIHLNPVRAGWLGHPGDWQ